MVELFRQRTVLIWTKISHGSVFTDMQCLVAVSLVFMQITHARTRLMILAAPEHVATMTTMSHQQLRCYSCTDGSHSVLARSLRRTLVLTG